MKSCGLSTLSGSSPLKQQLNDQAKNSYFFNAIRRVHRKQEAINKAEYDWKGRGHKVYPYKLSLNMCPWQYFRDAENYAESFEDVLVSSYRKSRGSAIHSEFQDWFLKSSIIVPKPNIELEYPKSKLNRIWPELPCLYEPAMISGQADGAFFYHGEICILELKTKNADEKGWEDSIKRPLLAHLTQSLFYADEMTEQKYWDQPVKWVCIAYLNTRFKPGDPRAEKEFYIEFDDYYKEKVKLLKEHLVLERNYYLNQEESVCTYPGCKDHANTSI